MKMILDLNHVVRELGLSEESFAHWKAANLDNVSASGSASWSGLEDSSFMNKGYHKAGDLKIG